MKPIALDRPTRNRGKWLLLIAVPVVAALAYFGYTYLGPGGESGRWAFYRALLLDPETFAQYSIQPGTRCGDAPFAFPTTGAIIGLWDQSYRPGHRHAGLDIFSGAEPGVTPVYAAYSGYLSRLPGWMATVIIRIPQDPLFPGRQIWTYYTHMATEDGQSFISAAFPPGTSEVYVEEGTLLGYMGNYSGNPGNPTGLHLHFSMVKDDGRGGFLNELDINNTYDPTPYLNLAVNHNVNPDDIPLCQEEVYMADWELVPNGK
jgi:murein DD-endopeptidase MepM/ murein hydrolase activator NlpD